MMKKILATLLTVILTVSCLTVSVGATADDDKIAPAVLQKIASATDDGMVVEIRHHNPNYPTEGVSEQDAVQNDLKAQSALFKEIEAFSRYEVGTFSIGRVNIGLPYSAIEKVAALDNVDYITLPEEGCYLPAEQKISDASKEKLAALGDSDKVYLDIWLAYNQQVYIGMDEPDDDEATHETVNAYLRHNKDRRKAYITAKNEEFTKRITDAVAVERAEPMKLFPIVFILTTADKVMDIAALPEVWTLDIDDTSEAPIDTPTEPNTTLDSKFQQWMWDTQKVVKQELYSEHSYDIPYSDYEELYVGKDWALIQAHVGILDPWEALGGMDFGDRILTWWTPGAAVYAYGLFVYDAAEDTFFPIDQVSPDDYAGILDVIGELHIGRALGDADGDHERTILDATAIQRDLADLEKLPEEDCYDMFSGTAPWKTYRFSDVDRDGMTTVMDATRIQRMVADLDETE